MDYFIQLVEKTIIIEKKFFHPVSTDQSINKSRFTLQTKLGTNAIKLKIFALTKPILNT